MYKKGKAQKIKVPEQLKRLISKLWPRNLRDLVLLALKNKFCYLIAKHNSYAVTQGVYIHWTGLMDWDTGLDYWTGLLD